MKALPGAAPLNLFLALLLLVAGCVTRSGGPVAGEPGQTPLATVRAASATAAPSPPGLVGCNLDAEVCAFAATLNRWLLTPDVDAILARTAPEQFECPGPRPQGLGGPYPLCDGAAPGERRSGYTVVRLQSEASVVSAQGYRDLVRTWIESADPARRDEFGPGTQRLYGIGCPAASAGGPASCRERFATVFSAIQVRPNVPQPHREQLIFFAARGSDLPALHGLGTAGVINEPAMLRGGAVQLFPWAPGERPGPGSFVSVSSGR
jgi:hypothetical protein